MLLASRVRYSTVMVAPHAGAWIEIRRLAAEQRELDMVAPHAGAWIEITPDCNSRDTTGQSLPMRERGLK